MKALKVVISKIFMEQEIYLSLTYL